MREINCSEITNAISKAVIDANLRLPEELEKAIKDFAQKESSELAKSIFSDMLENLNAAQELQIPVCQDCGMAVIFAEIGQQVHIVGGSFEDAVNKGVAKGYTEGYLRKSVVADPIKRVNTENNTPAIIHTRIVDGDKISFTVAPKGFGSENMSAIKMFNPSSSKEDIINFVVETVKMADARPCPPIVVGVGLGGDFEYCAYLSKLALCRSVDKRNSDDFYAEMEEDILKRLNALNIGPQGFSGDCTALACNIEKYPTHIAGLPVAVNIGCHVTRHVNVTI